MIDTALQRLSEEGLLSEARYLKASSLIARVLVTVRCVFARSSASVGSRVAMSIRLCVTVASTGSSSCVKPGSASLPVGFRLMLVSVLSKAAFWPTVAIRWT